MPCPSFFDECDIVIETRDFLFNSRHLSVRASAFSDGWRIRVFAGEGSADDVRDLAARYGCHLVVLTAQDKAWTRDPFAASPLYELVDSDPGQWRIYRRKP